MSTVTSALRLHCCALKVDSELTLTVYSRAVSSRRTTGTQSDLTPKNKEETVHPALCFVFVVQHTLTVTRY